MVSKLIDGDYSLSDSGEFVSVQFIEELLQNAFVSLNAERGRFYPNKDFGSGIRSLTSQPLSEYAFALAVQALDRLDGVFVKSTGVKNGVVTVDLIINYEEGQVKIGLENNL